MGTHVRASPPTLRASTAHVDFRAHRSLNKRELAFDCCQRTISVPTKNFLPQTMQIFAGKLMCFYVEKAGTILE
jgi:hypothetical protein